MEEIWKDVVGYEGLYQVSDLGNVRGVSRQVWNGGGYRTQQGETLKKNPNGLYIQSRLYKNQRAKMVYNHRVVAQAFIPNPENKETVHHINHVRDDNRVENLMWATRKEQIDDHWKEESGKSVVINEVKYRSQTEASQMLGVPSVTINSAIRRGNTSFKSNGKVYIIG